MRRPEAPAPGRGSSKGCQVLDPHILCGETPYAQAGWLVP